MKNVVNASQDLEPDPSSVVEDSEQVEHEYMKVASLGSSAATDPTEEVDYHYVYFTKTTQCSLWLLDGDRERSIGV